MPADTPVWIREAEVVSLLDIGDAIEALSDGLALEARGAAHNLPKTYVSFGGHSDLHAVGAAVEGAGLVGTKTWAHTPGGATPLLVLFDAHTGALRAVIEAFALGQLRTAAISGVATGALAVADAAELAIIGTGRQALPQAAAIVAVRPIERVRVVGRDAGRAEAFATRVKQTLGVEATVADSVARAVDGAPIVTCVTRATEPVLTGAMLAGGTHVNAVGAIALDRVELDGTVLDRCDVITTDTVDQARRLSRSLRDHLGDRDEAWKQVVPLSELLASTTTRPAAADVTVCKSMGAGISDLALGAAVYEAVVRNQLGTPLEPPARLEPRLRAARGVPRIGYV